MEEQAQARPLLLTKGINFTQLAVDQVIALDQRVYSMLFIGTGKAPPVTGGVPGREEAISAVCDSDTRVYAACTLGVWFTAAAIICHCCTVS